MNANHFQLSLLEGKSYKQIKVVLQTCKKSMWMDRQLRTTALMYGLIG